MVKHVWKGDRYIMYYGFKNKEAAKKFAAKRRLFNKRHEIDEMQVRVEQRKEGWTVAEFEY